VLLEPMLRTITDDPNAFAHRRGSAEWQLARALWDDGSTHDRDRARTLAAAAAVDDYQARDRSRKGARELRDHVARFQKRLDEIAAWRARRGGEKRASRAAWLSADGSCRRVVACLRSSTGSHERPASTCGIAKRLNRAARSRGQAVLPTATFARYLTTPTQTRNAIRYVLLNRKHHAIEKKFGKRWFEPFSSAPWFRWAEPLRADAPWKRIVDDEPPTAPPRTWFST